jgi:hypothetical protein
MLVLASRLSPVGLRNTSNLISRRKLNTLTKRLDGALESHLRVSYND